MRDILAHNVLEFTADPPAPCVLTQGYRADGTSVICAYRPHTVTRAERDDADSLIVDFDRRNSRRELRTEYRRPDSDAPTYCIRNWAIGAVAFHMEKPGQIRQQVELLRIDNQGKIAHCARTHTFPGGAATPTIAKRYGSVEDAQRNLASARDYAKNAGVCGSITVELDMLIDASEQRFYELLRGTYSAHRPFQPGVAYAPLGF